MGAASPGRAAGRCVGTAAPREPPGCRALPPGRAVRWQGLSGTARASRGAAGHFCALPGGCGCLQPVPKCGCLGAVPEGWGEVRRWGKVECIFPKGQRLIAGICQLSMLKLPFYVPKDAGSCPCYLQNYRWCCFVSVFNNCIALEVALCSVVQ